MTRFALFLCLMVAVLTGCLEQPQTNHSGSDPSTPHELNRQSDDTSIQGNRTQKFDDFSFDVPDGWTVVPPDREKTAVILLHGGTDWQAANGIIKIDTGKPAATDVHELARQAASDFEGKVSATDEMVDGIVAVRVDTLSKSKDAPQRITLIIRNGTAYLVMASANDGIDITSALDTIQMSWKWH